jgi:hypothetical protein
MCVSSACRLRCDAGVRLQQRSSPTARRAVPSRLCGEDEAQRLVQDGFARSSTPRRCSRVNDAQLRSRKAVAADAAPDA